MTTKEAFFSLLFLCVVGCWCHPIVSILSPQDQDLLVESNDIELVIEVDRDGHTHPLPPLTINISLFYQGQHVGDQVLEGTVGDGAMMEKKIPLTGLINGDYVVTAKFKGESWYGCSVTFTVDVAVSLVRVKEHLEEEEEACDEGVCRKEGGEKEEQGQEGREEEEEKFSEEDKQAARLCSSHGWEPRTRPARIYDTFTFNDEEDILKVRLHELNELVYKFVIVEADITFQYKSKPLHLDSSRVLQAYGDKVERVLLNKSRIRRGGDDVWAVEVAQRNEILEGLKDARPDDLIIIADVDEIPKRESLRLLRVCHGYTAPVLMKGHFHQYGFHLEYKEGWSLGPKVILRDMMYGAVNPQLVRMTHLGPSDSSIMEQAAWHLSWFVDAHDGGIEHIQSKFASFSHVEYNYENFTDTERLKRYIEDGRDFFSDYLGERMGGLMAHGSCDMSVLPRLVVEQPQEFAPWISHCDVKDEEEEQR